MKRKVNVKKYKRSGYCIKDDIQVKAHNREIEKKKASSGKVQEIEKGYSYVDVDNMKIPHGYYIIKNKKLYPTKKRITDEITFVKGVDSNIFSNVDDENNLIYIHNTGLNFDVEVLGNYQKVLDKRKIKQGISENSKKGKYYDVSKYTVKDKNYLWQIIQEK
jgi:hypothetical protein